MRPMPFRKLDTQRLPNRWTICVLSVLVVIGLCGCVTSPSDKQDAATAALAATPAKTTSWHGGGARESFTSLPGLYSLAQGKSESGSLASNGPRGLSAPSIATPLRATPQPALQTPKAEPRPLPGVQANYSTISHGERQTVSRVERLGRELSTQSIASAATKQSEEDRLVAILANAIRESRLQAPQSARFDPQVQRAEVTGMPEMRAEIREILPEPTPDTVSDVFIDTDIRQAIYSLASQVGHEVVVDDQVRGVVTTSLEGAPFERALRQLLHPLGYVYREVAGAYYVGVPDPESALFDHLADRYRYTALHRSPEELIAMIPKRRQVFVRPSTTGGWVIIEAPREHAERVLQELEELDTPVPQVVLEALICVYSPETSFRFGFDMDAGIRVFDRTTNVAVSGLTLTGLVGDAASANLNNFRVTNSVLRLLEQKGFVKIRASPRVMAQDNEKARIHIGRETFFSVQPETSGLVFRQDVQQVASGIMLEITPQIRSPLVTVKIDRAEVSEDIRSDETQANPSDRFPVINRRSVTTTVHVRDGETIVIGGLTQRQKVDQFNRTPGLSRLPLVGRLFERVEKVDQMVEVAIFISPRIVSPHGCQLAETDAPQLATPSVPSSLPLDVPLAYPVQH